MGLFGPSKKQRAAEAERWAGRAADEATAARKEVQKAAAYRESLKSGTSQDPAADRYLLRQAEENRRVASANARDFQQNAKALRRRWF